MPKWVAMWAREPVIGATLSVPFDDGSLDSSVKRVIEAARTTAKVHRWITPEQCKQLEVETGCGNELVGAIAALDAIES